MTRYISQSEEIATINAINEAIRDAGANWTAGHTSVSRLSIEDKQRLCGTLPEPRIKEDVIPSVATPESFDWRDHNGHNWMTPVKSQGSCGSCWAFGAVGAIEAAIKIYSNDPYNDVDLSEQHLVSNCCSNCGDCGGGYSGRGLIYAKSSGIPLESCFPYEARNMPCTPCNNWQDDARKITGYISRYQIKDLKDALITYGPGVTSIITPDDFLYYKGGVYEPVWASEGYRSQHHSVVIVGWSPGDVWIIKNSWGTGWGEDGYGLIYNSAPDSTRFITGVKLKINCGFREM